MTTYTIYKDMKPILTHKHWILMAIIAVVGGIAAAVVATVFHAPIWCLVLVCCTLVGIIAVREHALVLRHESSGK